MRKLTPEEYKDQNILKIELMVEAPPWERSSPEYSCQEQSMFELCQFVSPNTPAKRNYLLNLSHYVLMMLQMLCMVTTMLQCWKILSTPHHCKQKRFIPRGNQGLTIWFFPRSGAYRLRKHSIQFTIPHSVMSAQCYIHPCLGSLGQAVVSYGTEGHCITCTVIHFCHYSV